MIKTSDTQLAEQLARNIKAVIFDGDGVIFSGQVLVGPNGESHKTRSHIDGQGISLLRSAGFKVALVTAENSPFADKFLEKMNGLPSVQSGAWEPMEMVKDVIGTDKVSAVGAWVERHKLSWDECAYMGDDIGDYAVMEHVAFRACPASAEEMIKSFSHFVAKREGGNGAVRDFCNFLLDVKGINEKTLSLR